MLKQIAIGFLAGIFLCGILYFFAGRANYVAINETAKQISESNREAQQIGDTIRTRYDRITGTVARLDNRSAEIKSISLAVTNRSKELAGSSRRIESGINDVKITVDRIENRNREIVSIVGELRKANETFYKANQNDEAKK